MELLMLSLGGKSCGTIEKDWMRCPKKEIGGHLGSILEDTCDNVYIAYGRLNRVTIIITAI